MFFLAEGTAKTVDGAGGVLIQEWLNYESFDGSFFPATLFTILVTQAVGTTQIPKACLEIVPETL